MWRLTQPTWDVAYITPSWDLPVENPGSVAGWALSCDGSDSMNRTYSFTASAGVRSMTLDMHGGVRRLLLHHPRHRPRRHARTRRSTCRSARRCARSTAPPPPQCATMITVQRIDPSQVPEDAYAIQCPIVAPSTTIPVTGYIWDVHDGVSIVDHIDMPSSETYFVSGRLASPSGTKTASMYSYFTDLALGPHRHQRRLDRDVLMSHRPPTAPHPEVLLSQAVSPDADQVGWYAERFGAVVNNVEQVIRGKRPVIEQVLVVPDGRGPRAARGRARHRQDHAGPGAVGVDRGVVHPHPVHARPAAVRRHRRHRSTTRRPRRSSSTRGRSSPTSSSATRSTGRRPRPSRRCSR